MARRIFSLSIIASFMLFMALIFSRQSAYALTATVSRTPTTCSPVVVVTSTPSPTVTATPRVATATTTPTCGIRYITATPGTAISGPDLTVTSITYIGSSPSCANAPKNSVVITNNGNAAAGTFTVSYSAGGVAAPSQTVTGLAAGQSISLSFPSAGGAGMTVTATADSTNVIAETNESNNTGSAILAIPTQSPTCTPTGPSPITSTPTPSITPSLTITKTPTCFSPTRETLLVAPVTSPSSETTQVITVTLRNATQVSVINGTQVFTSTTSANGVFTITVTLTPNAVNNLQVQGTVSFQYGCQPYTLSTTVDSSGNPLTIVQGIVPTRTPTRTPTRALTPTPTATCPCLPPPCSPAVVITAPFAKDGAGAFCWQVSTLTSNINSWNTTSVTVNGVNFTNAYVPVSSLPAKVNGNWTIAYNAGVAWAHFEAK